MEPIRKKPVTPGTMTLPAAKTTEFVGPADNWWTLAKKYKRDACPWDIIFFNFQTYDPQEVNWYLYEKLGCRLTTPDGRNYCFGRVRGAMGDARSILLNAASSIVDPIPVKIPPDNWLPPGPNPAGARAAALAVLNDPIAQNIAFKIGGLELRPGDITSVAMAIASGKITVIHRPCLGHIAQYWTDNRFVIPFDKVPPVGGRALVVHEAVHAAMDIRKVPLTMEQSEVMGYVGQALYLRRNGLDLGNSLVWPPFVEAPVNYIAFTGIFKQSSTLAEEIDDNNVMPLDFLLLAASLRLAPMYSKQGAPNNDGI